MNGCLKIMEMADNAEDDVKEVERKCLDACGCGCNFESYRNACWSKYDNVTESSSCDSGVVPKWLPMEIPEVSIAGWTIIHGIDLRFVHRLCGQTRNFILDGRYNDAIIAVKEACGKVIAVLNGDRNANGAALVMLIQQVQCGDDRFME